MGAKSELVFFFMCIDIKAWINVHKEQISGKGTCTTCRVVRPGCTNTCQESTKLVPNQSLYLVINMSDNQAGGDSDNSLTTTNNEDIPLLQQKV